MVPKSSRIRYLTMKKHFLSLVSFINLLLGYLFCIKSLMMESLGNTPSSPCEPGPAQGFSLLG